MEQAELSSSIESSIESSATSAESRGGPSPSGAAALRRVRAEAKQEQSAQPQFHADYGILDLDLSGIELRC